MENADGDLTRVIAFDYGCSAAIGGKRLKRNTDKNGARCVATRIAWHDVSEFVIRRIDRLDLVRAVIRIVL